MIATDDRNRDAEHFFISWKSKIRQITADFADPITIFDPRPPSYRQKRIHRDDAILEARGHRDIKIAGKVFRIRRIDSTAPVISRSDNRPD